jgi:hypothetical protein
MVRSMYQRPTMWERGQSVRIGDGLQRVLNRATPARMSGGGDCPIPLARAMAWPEFRPSLPLIREACARHDGLLGPPLAHPLLMTHTVRETARPLSAHVHVAHTPSFSCDKDGQGKRRGGGRGLRHRIGPVFPMLGGLRS